MQFFGRTFCVQLRYVRYVYIYIYLLHACNTCYYNTSLFCYIVCLIEFWRSDSVFLSCQPVKVVGRPARNTELSRGVTLEIDRSPDARTHSAVGAAPGRIDRCTRVNRRSAAASASAAVIVRSKRFSLEFLKQSFTHVIAQRTYECFVKLICV